MERAEVGVVLAGEVLAEGLVANEVLDEVLAEGALAGDVDRSAGSAVALRSALGSGVGFGLGVLGLGSGLGSGFCTEAHEGDAEAARGRIRREEGGSSHGRPAWGVIPISMERRTELAIRYTVVARISQILERRRARPGDSGEHHSAADGRSRRAEVARFGR